MNELLNLWLSISKVQPISHGIKFGTEYIELTCWQIDELSQWVIDTRERVTNEGIKEVLDTGRTPVKCEERTIPKEGDQHAKPHEAQKNKVTMSRIVRKRGRSDILWSANPTKKQQRSKKREQHARPHEIQKNKTMSLWLANPTKKQHVDESGRQGMNKTWVQIKGCQLFTSHRAAIKRGQWLDTDHITAAQILLKEQFASIQGMQSPLLTQGLHFRICSGEFVQILHSEKYKHFHLISTIGCGKDKVNLYDSLYSSVPSDSAASIADIFHTSADSIQVNLMDVQKQCNGSDCGLFSIAFLTALCYGDDPTTVSFHHSLLRSHLIRCFEAKIMSPFPMRTRRPKHPIIRTIPIPIHCYCRQVQTGIMIRCDYCRKWFHQHCSMLSNEELSTISDRTWLCSNCQSSSC